MIGLLFRTLAGLFFLLGMLALALFVPAGTLSYWQAWLYLAIFASCVIFIAGYLAAYDRSLLERRLNVGPAAETQRSQQLIQAFANLFFLGLFVVAGLDHRFHWSRVPPAASLISDGMVVLSLFIIFLVFRENSFSSAIIEVSSGQRIISTGPYSVVRHPMYSAGLLLLLFSSPALGSWVGIPFALPAIFMIAARLLEEEKFLQARLEGYDDYRGKVRYRLIPLIW